MAPEVGSEAPDFSLRNQFNQDVKLSSFRDVRAVLLVFVPFAFSGTCTDELSAVRDRLADFQNNDVQVVVVSVDHVFALRAWADAQGYDFPLLSDFWPHGAVAKQYGVFLEPAGFALRGTFLIDLTGIVRFAEVKPPGEPRDQDVWRKALAEL